MSNKKLVELKANLEELKTISKQENIDFSQEIAILEDKINRKTKTVSLNAKLNNQLSRYKKKIYHRKTKLKQRLKLNQKILNLSNDVPYFKTYSHYPYLKNFNKAIRNMKKSNKVIRKINDIEELIGKKNFYKKYANSKSRTKNSWGTKNRAC